MTLPFTALTNARDTDPGLIRDLPRDTVVSRLREWFGIWEQRSGEVDHEVLGDAGILLGESGHPNIDGDAGAWHDERPSIRREEIVSDFLAGYWRTAAKANADVVLGLVGWLNRIPVESWPFAATLLALFVAATTRDLELPDAIRAEVRRRLLTELTALRRSGLHKGVAQYLDYLVDQ